MTWNVHGAGRPDLGALARVIGGAGVDVVGLQEVRRGQAERLAELLGVEEWRWLLKHRPLGPLTGTRAEGLAVLSTLPVHAYATAVLSPHVPLRSYRRRVMQELVVSVPVGPVGPVAPGLVAQTSARVEEGASAARVRVRVANVHLSSADGGDAAAQTTRALAMLAEPCGGVGIASTVLLGDLNTENADDVVGSFARAGLDDRRGDRRGDGRGDALGDGRADHLADHLADRLVEGWTDGWVDGWAVGRVEGRVDGRVEGRVDGRTDAPTNPADRPRRRIDQVLVGSGVQVRGVVVPAGGPRWAALSDHLPVVVELAVVGTGR